MRIWFLTINEPWPTDEGHPRLLRTGVMAQRYARQGDEIVWFNSSFYHARKIHRFDRTVIREVEPRLTIIGMYADAYRKNISVGRLLHNRQIGREFRKLLTQLPPPDAIVASMPLPELAYEASQYAKARNIPIVVDVRDLWPDIWLESAPRPLRPLAKLFLTPYYRLLRRAINDSTAVSGLSESCVDWGLGLGSRARNIFDKALPLAYVQEELPAPVIAEAERFWDAQGVTADPSVITVCYFGIISRRYEFDTVFQALPRLNEADRRRIRIVLCGDGERYEELKKAASATGIIMPGWMDAAQIETLKRRSQIGLLPYPSSPDYTKSMPNKLFDYLTGGLPILTCLTGVTGDLVAQRGCGWLYPNHDADALAAHLSRLVGSPAEIATAAANCRKTAGEFSADAIYSEFRTRLERMVEALRC
jgi:glycosyltransferase involved in cell wall biosynthesis